MALVFVFLLSFNTIFFAKAKYTSNESFSAYDDVTVDIDSLQSKAKSIDYNSTKIFISEGATIIDNSNSLNNVEIVKLPSEKRKEPLKKKSSKEKKKAINDKKAIKKEIKVSYHIFRYKPSEDSKTFFHRHQENGYASMGRSQSFPKAVEENCVIENKNIFFVKKKQNLAYQNPVITNNNFDSIYCARPPTLS